MIRAQIEILGENPNTLMMGLHVIPREGEWLCFNYGTNGEFTLVVKTVIYISSHTGLNETDPEVILRVTR